MEEEIYREPDTATYRKIIIVLLIVALGLLYLYYLLNKPLGLVGGRRLKGYSFVFSIYGAGADRLSRPTEVAVGRDGKIYVADTFRHRIMVFDKNGKYLTKFGKKGKGKGQIELPSGIAVDNEGRVYVVSYTLNKLLIYDRRYKPYWEVTFPGLGPLTATIEDRKLYVATRAGIMIGDLKGNLLTTLGRGGSKKGELNRPTGIVVDSKGNIYVADSMNYRIQALDKNGKPLWVVGASPPRATGEDMTEMERKRQFGLPTSITMDENGYLYVMDAFNGEIVIVSPKGEVVGTVGDWGKDDGQFYYPAGIAYAGGERFVVADKFNDRVQVVAIPSPAPAKPLRRISRWVFSPLIIGLLLLIAIILLVRMWYSRRKRALEGLEESYQT